FYRPLPRSHLHSFPTRRSSDLQERQVVTAEQRIQHVIPVKLRVKRQPYIAVLPLDDGQQVGTVISAHQIQPVSGVLRNLQHPLRSEEHTSELQSLAYLVCRLLL